jgi:hypothetical protein
MTPNCQKGLLPLPSKKGERRGEGLLQLHRYGLVWNCQVPLFNRIIAIVFAFTILFAAGCATAQRVIERAPSDEILELNLITGPIALNLDDLPGPDGFSVKVYAGNPSNPRPVPIGSGQLEVLIFDGTFFGKTNVPPALRTWTFTASELKEREFRAGIGIGYDFVLAWGSARPTRRLASVAARYTAPDGRVITSRPSSVAVIDK